MNIPTAGNRRSGKVETAKPGHRNRGSGETETSRSGRREPLAAQSRVRSVSGAPALKALRQRRVAVFSTTQRYKWQIYSAIAGSRP